MRSAIDIKKGLINILRRNEHFLNAHFIIMPFKFLESQFCFEKNKKVKDFEGTTRVSILSCLKDHVNRCFQYMQTEPKLAQYLLNDNRYHRSSESKEHNLEIVLMSFSVRGLCSLITSLQELKSCVIHQQGVSLKKTRPQGRGKKATLKTLRRSYDWKPQCVMCLSMNSNILGLQISRGLFNRKQVTEVWLPPPECHT